MAVIAVNTLDHKSGVGNIDSGIRALLNLGNPQKRLLHVIEDQLLAVPRLQPDGLGGFLSNDPRVRDRFLRYLVRIHRDAGEDRFAIRPGGDILMEAVMDAPNFKMSIRDHVPGLRIPFQNRQVGQPLIGGRHSYRAAAVDGGLIHMGNHRLGEGGEG